MKITFEISKSEEEDKARRLMACDDAFSLIWDLDQFMRGTLKYPPEFKTKDEEITYYYEKIEEARSMIGESNLMDLYQ